QAVFAVFGAVTIPLARDTFAKKVLPVEEEHDASEAPADTERRQRLEQLGVHQDDGLVLPPLPVTPCRFANLRVNNSQRASTLGNDVSTTTVSPLRDSTSAMPPSAVSLMADSVRP